ncbi:MAG TPA: alpha/beta hydrolase [Nonomuraea sp.]|nr:alpha/beta hydrolase [Nonomuraea sp.]
MTLAHDVAGSGPTVVLVHSTVCDRRMWDPQVPALVDAGFRVVRCDLRGFGQTPMPDRPYNNAQDVADLMDLLGAEQAALVAASGGGRAALEIAARWPERVTALVLLSTAWAEHESSAELREFGRREDELIEAGDLAGATELNVETCLGPHADEATREKVREMQRHAFEVQVAASEEVESIKVETDVTAITAPSLLISGHHDLPDFRQIAARLADQLADARHLHLDWAGHLPSLERPDVLNPVLIDFLRETRVAA